MDTFYLSLWQTYRLNKYFSVLLMRYVPGIHSLRASMSEYNVYAKPYPELQFHPPYCMSYQISLF